MRIYEYGKENPECILLIHPSLVTWDYFEYVIPLLEKHYHLLIPALPGYDLNDDSEFSSVEQIASELADDILKRGIQEVKAIYGCSIGGSIALRLAADGKLKAKNYIMDGGITPYQLPWILTRFIAVREIFRHCTYKTLWNTFDSCNNYKMPKKTMRFTGKVHYWYAEKECKARDWDLKYMKKYVPDTVFKRFKGMDHGDMALFYPERMARELLNL